MSDLIDAFQEIVDDVDAAVEDRLERVDEKIQEAQEALARELNQSAAPVLSWLRNVKPIITTPLFAIVLRYDDVVEVLGRHDRFSVALYEPKMLAITGPFILGLDDTPLYRHDDAALHRAIRRDDLDRIGGIISRAAEVRLEAVSDGETVNVVDVIDHAVAVTIAEYFGVPGPDAGTLVRWAKMLFHEIFINVMNDSDVREPALEVAAEMRPYIDRLIEQRKAQMTADSGAEPPDVLGRLVALQGSEPDLDDAAIRHNLIGLITGWIPTVSKAMTLAIDELLNRPDQLAGATDAARAGRTDVVSAYVFEALRFQPQNAGLLRKCEESTIIARGTTREAEIDKGAVVFVGTQAAMMDPEAFPEPKQFKTDRPYESYLHFGHGLHRCIGEPINRIQMPALATAILKRGIRRHDDGQLEWNGPFPSGLSVVLGTDG
ncbi:MAG TPA: cytochrome P450 [Solirubrobacterales bacterium]|jgi:cytochrome P450|nr:cytochrome P450 [Solirubrobacterales bacterium]